MNSTDFNAKFEVNIIKGCVLETAVEKKLKKIGNIILIISIGIIFSLSIIALTKWLTFDTVYTQGVTDTMRAKNGLKSKTTYAGASGEGRMMKSEDNNER
jgi:hypothetical protein